jgi:hypothetical protein
MVLVKASPESEAGEMPSTEDLAEMGKYNEELVKAGVMLAGEGIAPTSRGKRVQFNGPTERRLIAGYWLWQVKSMDEAVEWLKRAPFQEGVLEIRPVLEEEDFGEEFTPELREQERRIREQTEQSK